MPSPSPLLSTGARRLALVVLCASWVLAPSVAADVSGATIDKTGWWTRSSSTVATPAAPVTAPSQPGIPEDDLAVSSTGVDETAVLAVGIQPDEDPGGTVNSFTMVLKEDPDVQGNQGGANALLVACPIVEFWAGGPSQNYDDRPDVDCEAASAPGTRDDDGNWTFDLKPIGDLWFDPFGTIRADGVIVRPAADNTAPFQVVVFGDDIDIDLDVTPAPDADDDGFALPPAEDAPVGTGSNSGGSLFSPPVVTSPPTTRAPSVASPAPAPTAASPSSPADSTSGEVATPTIEETATPVASSPAADRRGDVLGNWPPALVLLVPLLLALMAATSYWLGPQGNPATATVRQRGVSRALDAQASQRNRT